MDPDSFCVSGQNHTGLLHTGAKNPPIDTGLGLTSDLCADGQGAPVSECLLPREVPKQE